MYFEKYIIYWRWNGKPALCCSYNVRGLWLTSRISRRYSHTHTHSHTPNTCTNAEKRASGRPTNRLMASVRKAIHTTRNWSENKTKKKKKPEKTSIVKTITKQVSASKQETTINKPPKYYIPYSRSVESKFSLKFRAEWEFLSSLPCWKSATLYDPLSQVSCADGSPLCSYKSALYIHIYIHIVYSK